MTEKDELTFAIEALLFASERPLSAKEIKNAFEEDLSAADVAKRIESLREDYKTQNRGFQLMEIAGGWQIVSDARFASYLKRFYTSREKKKVTHASLETLAIIAYKQPATRADIEFIRGVNVDGAMKTLMERGFVAIVGKKDVPGRPLLYGTTNEFLQHFGLTSTDQLPPLSQFSEKDLDPSLLPPEMRQAAEAEARKAEEEEVGRTDEGEPSVSDTMPSGEEVEKEGS